MRFKWLHVTRGKLAPDESDESVLKTDITWDSKLYQDQKGNNDGHSVWEQQNKNTQSQLQSS
jgi:hypothetical protein